MMSIVCRAKQLHVVACYMVYFDICVSTIIIVYDVLDLQCLCLSVVANVKIDVRLGGSVCLQCIKYKVGLRNGSYS